MKGQVQDHKQTNGKAEEDTGGASAMFGFLRILNREELRRTIINDSEIPQGLRELIQDNDFWEAFKPTGAEIYAALQKYGMFSEGKAADFADALRLIRRFFSA